MVSSIRRGALFVILMASSGLLACDKIPDFDSETKNPEATTTSSESNISLSDPTVQQTVTPEPQQTTVSADVETESEVTQSGDSVTDKTFASIEAGRYRVSLPEIDLNLRDKPSTTSGEVVGSLTDGDEVCLRPTESFDDPGIINDAQNSEESWSWVQAVDTNRQLWMSFEKKSADSSPNLTLIEEGVCFDPTRVRL